jgi:hypothetical protein
LVGLENEGCKETLSRIRSVRNSALRPLPLMLMLLQLEVMLTLLI